MDHFSRGNIWNNIDRLVSQLVRTRSESNFIWHTLNKFYGALHWKEIGTIFPCRLQCKNVPGQQSQDVTYTPFVTYIPR